MTFDPQPHPPKTAPPGLYARAPRPRAIRLRPTVAVGAAGAAAGLVAGALAWAFVVQPHLRAQARADATATPPEPARGGVRPADAIRAQPATYDRLAQAPLPPPRGLGTTPRPEARPSPRPRMAGASTSPDHGLGAQAARSGLLVAIAGDPDRRAFATTPAPAPQAPVAGPAVQGGRGLLTAPRSPFEIQAGSLLPAVLLTGVDTARPGPVVASLTEDVFDTVSGRHLLAPRGAKLLGRHEGADRHGDRRAFVTWDRLVLPNGKSVSLAGEPGVDAEGAVGIAGAVDRRLGPLALAALVGGAVTTLGEAARRDSHGGGLLGDAGDAAAIDAAQVGGRMVDRELDVKPSIRVSAGARVRVLLTHDLILEPYVP